MIVIVDGLQGSGKTYYAVDYIWNHKNDYFHIYTNIDGFKFQANILEYTDTFFIGLMSDAYDIYLDEDKSDKDILDYFVSAGFLDSSDPKKLTPVLIVIDEVHNQLDSKDNLWTWFITYHRHLFIDAIFITQDANLIYYGYRSLFQEIYHAMSASKILFGKNKFKYQKHLKLPIRDGKYGTFVENVFVKKSQQIFDLYHSGDKVRAKSVFVRYYWIIAIAILLGVSAFYKVYHSLTYHPDSISHKQIETDSFNSKVKHIKRGKRDNINDSSPKYLLLDCMFGWCFNAKFDVRIRVGDLQAMIEDTDSKFLHSFQLSDDAATVYLLASPDFLNLFQKRSYNREKGFNSIR